MSKPSTARLSKTPGDLPRLRGDGRRLRQIRLNLISNAIIFTPEKGKVVVLANVNNAGAISICASDTGIGIEPADMDNVLMPFRQVKEAYVSNPGERSGLGLSLVNSLMILHGGSLDIDSAPGEGTRVTISFPPQRTMAKV